VKNLETFLINMRYRVIAVGFVRGSSFVRLERGNPESDVVAVKLHKPFTATMRGRPVWTNLLVVLPDHHPHIPSVSQRCVLALFYAK
jgi:hypothetical protein